MLDGEKVWSNQVSSNIVCNVQGYPVQVAVRRGTRVETTETTAEQVIVFTFMYTQLFCRNCCNG